MIIEKFKATYLSLNKDNLECLSELYCDNAVFIDPFNQIDNLSNLKKYFSELYENVKTIDFDFIDFSSDNDNHYITWDMKLVHPKLNSGKEFSVYGATHLKSNESNKIIYHRDYFDAGSMIYERIPIFGRIVLWIKNML